MKLLYLSLFLTHIASTLSSQGPFLSWGVNYKIPTTDNVEESSSKTVLENLLGHLGTNEKLLLFVQPEFSVEDVTLWGNSLQSIIGANSNVWLPAVSHPVTTVKSIISAQDKASKIINPLSMKNEAFSNADLFVVNLPTKEDQSDHDYNHENANFIKDVIEKLGNKKAVAMLTGTSNVDDCEKDVHLAKRHILAAEVDAKDSDGRIYNVSGEILLFVKQINMSMVNKEASKIYNEKLNLTQSTVTGGSGKTNASVEIDFSSTEIPNVESAVFKMNFEMAASQWKLSSFTVTLNENETRAEYVMKTPDIDVPIGFSFTCHDVVATNKTDGNTLTVTFMQLQIQPFGVKHSKFSTPYDCLGVLSIPIWMGLIVTLAFTVILIVGTAAVMSIKTMDKFDDPKGKTITVPVTD